MQPDMQDVEKVFESLEQSQRKIADKWSEVMRTTALPSQNDVTETLLRSQNEIMRIALRAMEPNGFASVASNWITLPRALSATTLELQRRILEAWVTRDELRPEAIAQRWIAPWIETIRACQEATARMLELQSTTARSLGSEARTERSSSRQSSSPKQGRRVGTNGRRVGSNGRKSRSSQAARAH